MNNQPLGQVVVMGDDTWGSLYPDALHRRYLYDSFNVRDLYTVDNGVHEHLLPEMKSMTCTNS